LARRIYTEGKGATLLGDVWSSAIIDDLRNLALVENRSFS
jgi:hypothetical protein